MFEEILEASGVLDEIDDASRVEAWASSVMGVWSEDPDAAAIAAEFIEWLAGRDDVASHRLLLAMSVVTPVASDLSAAARTHLGDHAPPWVDHLGTAVATRAWTVSQSGARSIGIGFAASDGSEHSLLADIGPDGLEGLLVGPGPDELFDGSEDLIELESCGPTAAAHELVEAWRSMRRCMAQVPETVHVNGALGIARLAAMLDEPLDDLLSATSVTEDDGDPAMAVGTEERRELDRWALAILDGALGTGTAQPLRAELEQGEDPEALNALLDTLDPRRIAEQPAAEREAYAALEWADWLGIVIGAVRAGPGTAVSPPVLVDFVNRCPEVTSSIPRSERPYFEWALSMVVPAWRRAGVLDEGDVLTASGVAMLPAALRRAWTDAPA